MLTVACYLWHDPSHKNRYGADDVRILQRMVARNLTLPHEFACITDRPELFEQDEAIRAIPLDKTTHVQGTCFVKLMTFHPNGAEIIGERVLVMDLDCAVVGSMNSLVDRADNLVLWRNPTRIPWDNPVKKGRPYYNTSMVLHACGTAPELWRNFEPDFDTRNFRDDQWLISAMVGPFCPYWDGRDGVYRLAREDTPGSGVNGALPDLARVVFFPGSEGKPDKPEIAAANPWIAEFRI